MFTAGAQRATALARKRKLDDAVDEAGPLPSSGSCVAPKKAGQDVQHIVELRVVNRSSPAEAYLMGRMLEGTTRGSHKRVVGVTRAMSPNFDAIVELIRKAIQDDNLDKAGAIALRDKLVKIASAV